MKKTMLLVALVAVLLPFVAVSAAAQDVKATVQEYVLVPGTAPVMSISFAQPDATKPPSYCGEKGKKNTCLMYTGDFNYNNGSSPANGLFNGDSSPLGITAYVYSAFKVPKKGKGWDVTDMFINTLSNSSGVDATAPYDTRTGVTSGSGGKEGPCHGTAAETWAATGRTGFSLTEYTDKVEWSKSCTLKAGTTYWMNILTGCTTSSCNGDLFYESDEESQPGINQYPAGKSGEYGVWDDQYFNSSSFGYTWAPTWGSSGACGGTGCDQFSFGISGTAIK